MRLKGEATAETARILDGWIWAELKSKMSETIMGEWCCSCGGLDRSPQSWVAHQPRSWMCQESGSSMRKIVAEGRRKSGATGSESMALIRWS